MHHDPPTTHPEPRWRPIPGWEGLYEVSDDGRVHSMERTIVQQGAGYSRVHRARILKPYDSNGHKVVQLSRGDKLGRLRQAVFVHRLVLLAFVGPRPEGAITRHLNGNGFDNRLANIVYGTSAENSADQRRLGELCVGESHGKALLNDESVRHIRREMARGKRGTAREMARLFGVRPTTILDVADRRTWKHLPQLPDEVGSRWHPRTRTDTVGAA